MKKQSIIEIIDDVSLTSQEKEKQIKHIIIISKIKDSVIIAIGFIIGGILTYYAH